MALRFETSLGQARIKFRHNHPWIEMAQSGSITSMLNSIITHQGTTECTISFDDNPEFDSFGRSFVHPDDTFVKDTGRFYALQYALEFSELTPAQQREIWAGYYSR